MKNILLIGGTGAIGKAIHPLLLDLKYNVADLSSKLLDVRYTDELSFIGKEHIDIVVNLAGITQNGLLCDVNYDTRSLVGVNCIGAVNVLAGFLPHMQKRKYGRIIMISSIYSKINVVGQGVYSASKAFVDKLVQVAAIENAQYGITVNSIQLGYMGIGMGEVFGEAKEKALNKVALHRFCDPQELVNTIDYIINTEYFTGQNLTLGGGIK